jgi:hypothetical protein
VFVCVGFSFRLTRMGEAVQFFDTNGFSKKCEETNQLDSLHNGSWYEEVIDDDLKWSFAVKRFVAKSSEFSPSTSLSNYECALFFLKPSRKEFPRPC